jgi:hypothetical protein
MFAKPKVRVLMCRHRKKQNRRAKDYRSSMAGGVSHKNPIFKEREEMRKMDKEWLRAHYRDLGYSEERIKSIIETTEQHERDKDEEIRRLKT